MSTSVESATKKIAVANNHQKPKKLIEKDTNTCVDDGDGVTIDNFEKLKRKWYFYKLMVGYYDRL